MNKENTGNENIVTDISLEVIAKSLLKEAAGMGFKREHYIKLVNILMDEALNGAHAEIKSDDRNKDLDYLDPKINEYPLVGERIKIRRIAASTDIPFLEKWLNDSEGRLFLLTRTTARNYTIDNLIAENKDLVGIITTHDDIPIGMMAFLDIDKVQRKAELRKMIGEKSFKGKGLGKEATKLWINYGANVLHFKKIYLNTLEANVRNIRINRELGFYVEGVFKNECLIDGEYKDILRMGLLLNQ
ncbi:MAG: GNAT family N-acetyltransferase [Chlorobi bacterium]|nr:GNAT family N-acetyltransferase [Chlorobiota bacterium]